jgi:hypothetical protein
MPLLEVLQTRQSAPLAGQVLPVSVSAKLPPWMLPNLLRGRHMAGWSSLRQCEREKRDPP